MRLIALTLLVAVALLLTAACRGEPNGPPPDVDATVAAGVYATRAAEGLRDATVEARVAATVAAATAAERRRRATVTPPTLTVAPLPVPTRTPLPTPTVPAPTATPSARAQASRIVLQWRCSSQPRRQSRPP